MSETVKKTKSQEPAANHQEPMEPNQEPAANHQEPMEPNQEPVYNPWKDMHSIKLPRGKVDEARTEYAAVNGKTYQIPRGKTVEVPLPIYEVLMRREEARDELEDYRDSISKESNQN